MSSSYNLSLSLSHILLKDTLKGQSHFPQITNEETDMEKLKITIKERQLYGSKTPYFALDKPNSLKM